MAIEAHSSPKPCKKQEVGEKLGCLELFLDLIDKNESTSGKNQLDQFPRCKHESAYEGTLKQAVRCT